MADFVKDKFEKVKMNVPTNAQFKDHPFDVDDSKNKKRKRKTRTTTEMEPLCGVPPIRAKFKYRGDESEINPVVRNNLTSKDIEFAFK